MSWVKIQLGTSDLKKKTKKHAEYRPCTIGWTYLKSTKVWAEFCDIQFPISNSVIQIIIFSSPTPKAGKNI